MHRLGLLFVVAPVLLPARASAQAVSPLGSEFRVNTATPNAQDNASIGADGAGNFVVVWETGTGQDVLGQRFNAAAAPLGPEFRVNSYVPGQQVAPAVAVDASGNFLVVWSSYTQDGSSGGVFGQRYASSGAPIGPEFRVNTYTTNSQRMPSAAAEPSGSFVVVWEGGGQDGSSYGVFGQRYEGTGTPLGPEFRVNTHTTLDQRYPSIAADPAGNFMVVWRSSGQDGSGYGIFGQLYASSGSPLGAEFRVNTTTTGTQMHPAVAADGSGNFVVVWQGVNPGGSGSSVFGQRYASGLPAGPEFRVNSAEFPGWAYPSVAADSAGNFVVVSSIWDFILFEFNLEGQRFASTGVPFGQPFAVNEYTTDFQTLSSVVARPSGDFVVTWQSNQQEGPGSGYGIYARRFGQIVPVELMQFGVE